MAENPKRIDLTGSGRGRHEELRAAEAITPGHLCAVNSAGKVAKHASAGGWSEAMFALEDALQGNEIGDAYSADDLVALTVANKGDDIYAWLAAGESVNPSSGLTSNADGTLKAATGTDVVIARPLETLDNSDTGAVDARLKVRVV